MGKVQEKKVATEFEAALTQDRTRRRNQDLAQKLLGGDRRKSAGPALNTRSHDISARGGIKKDKRQSTSAIPDNSLAARIAAPGTRKAKKIADAIEKVKSMGSSAARQQVNVRGAPPANAPRGPKGPQPTGLRTPAPTEPARQRRQKEQQSERNQQRSQQRGPSSSKNHNNKEDAPVATGSFPVPPAAQTGLSIRGLAGPYVVGAENFAEGTTAADIESAVAPVGGVVHGCKILKTRPIVVAEVVLESREGAERVVKYFNGRTADGRVLNFYAKLGAPSPPPAGTYSQAQPRKSAPVLVDGTQGFGDPMEMDSNDKDAGGLYSDIIVPAQRKGRGFSSWGGPNGPTGPSSSRSDPRRPMAANGRGGSGTVRGN